MKSNYLIINFYSAHYDCLCPINIACVFLLLSDVTQRSNSTQSVSSTPSTIVTRPYRAHSDSPCDSVALMIKVTVCEIQSRLEQSCARGVEDVFPPVDADREVFQRAHQEYSQAIGQLEEHLCAYLRVYTAE